MIKIYIKGFVGNLGTKILIEEKQEELIHYFNKEFICHIKNELDQSLIGDGFNPSLIMPNQQCRGERQCRGECLQSPRMGELRESLGYEVVDYEVIGKGGVLASLWKICDRNKWGLRYDLKKIPILQGTVEIANYFDLNPYRLLTKNSYIVACELEEASDNEVVSDNVGASIASPHIFSNIGYITNEKKRVRIDGEAEAFLTKDFKDEIDKIIPNYTKK